MNIYLHMIYDTIVYDMKNKKYCFSFLLFFFFLLLDGSEGGRVEVGAGGMTVCYSRQ